jgi:hypothetical protein
MKPTTEQHLKTLETSLEDLVKVYRLILNIVRKEKEILIAANLDELAVNNRTKEAALMKVKEIEDVRRVSALELAHSEGLDPDSTRLLDFARHFDGAIGDRLRKMHSVLDLLMKRVREHNQYNEVLVGSALNNLTGAMDNLRDNLGSGKTYKKSGAVAKGPAEAGSFVRKEA